MGPAAWPGLEPLAREPGPFVQPSATPCAPLPNCRNTIRVCARRARRPRGPEGPGAPRPQQGPACSLCGKYLFWFEWTPFHKDHLVVINNTYFQIICRSLGRAHGTHPNRDLFKGNCKWAGFTAARRGGRVGAPGKGRGSPRTWVVRPEPAEAARWRAPLRPGSPPWGGGWGCPVWAGTASWDLSQNKLQTFFGGQMLLGR